MVTPNVLTADLEIWTDDHSLICKLRRFAIDVSGEDKDLKETYNELIVAFDVGEMGNLAQRIIGRFEREIYRLFIVDSDPSGNDRGWSMEDMKGEQFDWWEVCPHLVVTCSTKFSQPLYTTSTFGAPSFAKVICERSLSKGTWGRYSTK